MNEEVKQASILKYTLWFSLFYIIAVIAIGAIYVYFDVGGSGSNIVMAIAAAVATGGKFSKDHQRPIAKREKWVLAFWCLIASVVTSTLLAMILMLFLPDSEIQALRDLIEILSLSVWAIIILVVSVVYFGVIGLFLGVGSKSAKAKDKPVENV